MTELQKPFGVCLFRNSRVLSAQTHCRPPMRVTENRYLENRSFQTAKECSRREHHRTFLVLGWLQSSAFYSVDSSSFLKKSLRRLRAVVKPRGQMFFLAFLTLKMVRKIPPRLVFYRLERQKFTSFSVM